MDKRHPRTESLIYSYHLDIAGKTTIPPQHVDPRYIEYRKMWEINPIEQIVSDFPLHLDIEVSGDCNLMCSHCFRFSRRMGTGDMEFDLFKSIINEGAEHNLSAINSHWMGESFLHPNLVEMIQYAKSNGILDIRINTNGTLMDHKLSERILESGLDTIIFSIDAVTEKTYNQIKVGSDFREVNQNVEYFINLKERMGAEKPKIIVQMIDYKQTHEELMSFIYYWKPKVDGIRIATYQSPDGNPHDKNRVQNSPETIFPCPQLWQRLVIAWNGNVYPCVGDNAGREQLGNVRETSLYEMWHGDRLNYLRKKHSYFEADDIEACLHCDLNKVPNIINGYNGANKNGG